MRHFVLALCVTLLAQGACAQPTDRPIEPTQPGEAQTDQSDSEPPTTPQERSYTADYQRACTQPSNREEADLCQQFRAANAASESARIAGNQFWATIVETGLLVVTLFLSGWAALAASSAAKTARRELEELERPNLLVHFKETGAVESEGLIDMPNETKFVFHNYGRSPGFMVTVNSRLHYRKDEDGLPEPVNWMRKRARIFSYGSIIKQDGESEIFSAKARDWVSEDDVRRIGRYGRWYLLGFAGYHDSMNGLYTLGFCMVFEDGEWRIAAADSVEDNRKYNYSKRYRRPKLGVQVARGVGKVLRKGADKLAPLAEPD